MKTPMTILLVLLLNVLPTFSVAAMDVADTNTPLTDRGLENLRSYAKEVISAGYFGNCGRVKSFRFEKNDSRTAKQLVESLMDEKFIETIETESLQVSEDGVIQALSRVIDDGKKNPRAAELLQSLAVTAILSQSDLELFAGLAAGAFEISLGTMAVVDHTHYEVLVIQEGYCE